MTVIPRARRLACVLVALVAAAGLFRVQLAEALVTRGDDALRNGDATGALRAYDRALHLDPASAIAADRLAFFLALRHDRASAERAVAIASAALALQPRDATLAADRGFAEMRLQRWRPAELDFAAAGLRGDDARYDHFAARMALRRGDRRAARAYAQRAIAADPTFHPAYALLRSVR